MIIIENYSNEIDRLSLELKSSVKEQHPISFEQLYNDCINVDKLYCLGFKSEHINKKLKDEKFRYLVDNIYADARKLMSSFKTCAGIKRRLEALVGTKTPHYENNDKINIKPHKKLRHNQLAKKKCREIAKKIWKAYPQITIADMIDRPDLLPHTTKRGGSLYTEKTIRNWIKDLCPDRSPGRRKRT